MTLTDIFRIALNALRVNKLRSLLTMLGIIIGVAAVITMIAIGAGAQAQLNEQIKSLGSNLMIITNGSSTSGGVRMGAGANQSLTEDDAGAIVREIPEIQVAAPSSRGTRQVVAGNNNWLSVIIGAYPDYFEAREWSLASGRMFEPAETSGAAKVALIGQTVSRQLFGDMDPVGQQIRIGQVPFQVIGLLERKGQSLIGQDQDDVVIVPLSTARTRIFGNVQGKLRRVGSIQVKVREAADMKQAEESVRELMRQRQRTGPAQEEGFILRNLTELVETQAASSRVMTLLLAAVASVSLLVGGIGIMNIMLVSVTERTREIGLRMAVGARGRDILKQFLVESVTLSLLGGLVGIGLGALASWLIGEFAGWPVALSAGSIVLAVGFSGAIGVFFGFYPARKAAAMLPIQALRYE